MAERPARAMTRPDVAIWANANPRAEVTLRRIAEACVQLGLRTVLLWWRRAARGAVSDQFLQIPGVVAYEVRVRQQLGPLRYPRPASLLLLRPGVAQVLRTLRPRVMLTQLDHSQIDRVWQYEARRQGCAGVVVQEGMANVPKTSSAVALGERWSWGKGDLVDELTRRIPHPLLERRAPYMFAQYVCAWGDVMRRHLVRLGRDGRTVFVTGSPAFDHVRTLSMGPRGGDYVLYVQQRMGMPLARRLPAYEHLVRVVTKEIGARLVFKLHPNSRTEAPQVRALAERLDCPEGSLEIVDEGDAVDLLANARAVLVATSTTAYHALVAGVPVVVLDYYSEDVRFDVASSEAVAVVGSPGELAGVLGRVLGDDALRDRMARERSQLLSDHLCALDGRASFRVADVLRTLAGR